MAVPGNKRKGFAPPLAGAAGFTLVELMIGMALAGLVMVAIYTSFQMQQDTFIAQDQVVMMQQDLRASMETVAQDIRLAGYDPDHNVGAGFTTATATSVRMTMDIHNGADDDADGLIDEPDEIGHPDGNVLARDEDVTYALDAANKELDRTVNYRTPPFTGANITETRTLAQHVEQLEFFYTLADGTTTLAPATPADIRAVEVSILVSGGTISKDKVSTQTFTSGSGVAWTCPTGYRCRMLNVFIQCRNMGL